MCSTFVPEAPRQSSVAAAAAAAAALGGGQPVGAESGHLHGGGRRRLADATVARGGVLGLVDGVAGVGADGPVVPHLPSDEITIRL